MESNNLQYNILDKLASVSDASILQKIDDLLETVDLGNTKIKLTDAQNKMLMSSEEDVRNGKITTDEDLIEEENKWLNE
ncbi:MAG: hypothetical protein M3015_08560 [Bacteroidota bacterium]|nr:hypothetical protein [Bacteroidota bacterium]